MRVLAGPEKKTRIISEKEKAITAYHEMGHALVGHFLEYTDPVHKISVVSRGQALGYTISLPTEDKFLTTKQELMDTLAMTLGGRAAEEVVFGEITTGAANDLEKATGTAKQMIMRYGMSEELGPRTLGHDQSMPFLGREFQQQADYSEEIAQADRRRDPAHHRGGAPARQGPAHREARAARPHQQDPHRCARPSTRSEFQALRRRRARGRGLPRARREGGAHAVQACRRERREAPARQAAAGAQAGARQPGQPRGDLTRRRRPSRHTWTATRYKHGVRLILEGIGEDPDASGPAWRRRGASPTCTRTSSRASARPTRPSCSTAMPGRPPSRDGAHPGHRLLLDLRAPPAAVPRAWRTWPTSPATHGHIAGLSQAGPRGAPGGGAPAAAGAHHVSEVADAIERVPAARPARSCSSRPSTCA